MSGIAGSLISISFNGERFSIAADAEASIDLGGTGKDVLINGDGTKRNNRPRKRWSITGISVAIESPARFQRLQEIQSQEDDVTVELEAATEDVFAGEGTIVGDELRLSTGSSTVDIECAGGGVLAPI